jgi:transcriptional regulator with XRE-family HTH domain
MRQVDVGRAAGISAVHVSRVERGVAAGVRYRTLAGIAAAVGLKLWVRAYPLGRRLLDEPQLRKLAELRRRAGAGWSWRTEVGMPIVGDLRAADAVISNGTSTIQIEVITRLVDFQAQSRAALLKKRDLPADRLVLVISGSHANRRALAEARDVARASFPLGTREVLRCLAAGVVPPADGIVLL